VIPALKHQPACKDLSSHFTLCMPGDPLVRRTLLGLRRLSYVPLCIVQFKCESVSYLGANGCGVQHGRYRLQEQRFQ
jgi:hypothetical protein